MLNRPILAALLCAVSAGTAQAQSTCTCNAAAARTASAAALQTLLSNRMVCGNVGSEVWQEWHNGTNAGPVVDYKLGPGNATDPSEQVGTYSVNGDNTVTYAYGSGGSGGTYTYDVCFVNASNSYTFCGAQYGGRNVTGTKIGGAGLTPCSSVVNVAPALTTRK